MKTRSEKFYDWFTVLYPAVDIFLKPQKRKFFGRINALPYGRLLEIGVGNGAHFKYYSTHDIVGIDTSRSMLDRADGHRTANIQLVHMNGEALLFPNETFDYVILSHVVAVVEDPQKLLEEVHRVLKSTGKVFILNHFTPDNWLKYLDRTVEKFSGLLHFRSVFPKSSLNETGKFRLLNEFNAGMFSYFKILVYEKNL
jgi:phosphatidylethanolamine/phosphatidyl-N-methylethanolamine N-methyltransferase